MASEFTNGTANITATEWSLTTASAGPVDNSQGQATVQLFLDLWGSGGIQIGDEYRVRFYDKIIAGSSLKLVDEWIITGFNPLAVWFSPAFMVVHAWDFTLQYIAGTSGRTFLWSIRKA